MPKIILLNKPFQLLSQFTDPEGRKTLADIPGMDKYPSYYAAGRLDYDSEGLLILTDNGKIQERISAPNFKLPKTYWVQVEGNVDESALNQLRSGVTLKDGLTTPARAEKLNPPENIWPRNPPIRERKNIPTSWLSLTITEGKNRQVRRMTSAVGYPTLRLIRIGIGNWSLDGIPPGKFKTETIHLPTSPNKQRKYR